MIGYVACVALLALAAAAVYVVGQVHGRDHREESWLPFIALMDGWLDALGDTDAPDPEVDLTTIALVVDALVATTEDHEDWIDRLATTVRGANQ